MKRFIKLSAIMFLAIVTIYTISCKKSDVTDNGNSGNGNNGGGTSIITPTVITTNVSNITAHSAKASGFVEDDGGNQVTERGLYWGTHVNPTINDNKEYCGKGIGAFNNVISYALKPNTTYYVRAYAKNINGISYGEDVCFTTCEQSSYDIELTNELKGTHWTLIKVIHRKSNGQTTTYYPSHFLSLGDPIDVMYRSNGDIKISGTRKGDWYFEDGDFYLIYDSDCASWSEIGAYACVFGEGQEIIQKLTNDELVYYKDYDSYVSEYYFEKIGVKTDDNKTHYTSSEK